MRRRPVLARAPHPPRTPAWWTGADEPLQLPGAGEPTPATRTPSADVVLYTHRQPPPDPRPRPIRAVTSTPVPAASPLPTPGPAPVAASVGGPIWSAAAAPAVAPVAAVTVTPRPVPAPAPAPLPGVSTRTAPADDPPKQAAETTRRRSRPRPGPAPRGAEAGRPASLLPARAAGSDSGGRHRQPDPPPGEEAIEERDAVGFAMAFAADLTSWDRTAPDRRAEALRRYFPPDGEIASPGVPAAPPRQRAEMVVPGRVVARTPLLVIVSVQVRVTPYEQYPGFTGPLDPRPAGASCRWPGALPAAAAPPWEFGWQAGPSEWIPLDVPVGRHTTGQLVVVVDLDLWRT